MSKLARLERKMNMAKTTPRVRQRVMVKTNGYVMPNGTREIIRRQKQITANSLRPNAA